MAGHLVPRFELGSFNYLFMIWSGVFGIVAVLFLFYFNRLAAWALFGLIRLYTWLFYRVDISCQSFQFSLLGGRVFLRGLEYRGENETITVHQAYITWRYWYRRVADVTLDSLASSKPNEPLSHDSEQKSQEEKGRHGATRDEEVGKPGHLSQAPCRIAVHVRGVEWFIYNRSPVFDAIVASATHHTARPVDDKGGPALGPKDSDDHTLPNSKESLKSAKSDSGRLPDQQLGETSPENVPFFLKLLPVAVDCTKAAMVMGNQHTRSVMVAKVDGAQGQITASSCGIYDKYRQHFDFQLKRPVVLFLPNEDYTEPLLKAGSRLNGFEEETSTQRAGPVSKHPPKRAKHRARQAMSRLIPRFRRSVESFERMSGSVQQDTTALYHEPGSPEQPGWIGLTRYLDEEEEGKLGQEKWLRTEYAEEQTIVDCPSISMDFYWDVPGPVPYGWGEESYAQTMNSSCEINGSEPPEWSLDIRIAGGKVNYGPWADRQRLDLMHMFFPSAQTDAIPAIPLTPGQSRISTVFKIIISLEEKVDLRLHTKEPSKDWKHKLSDQTGPKAKVTKEKKKQPKKQKVSQATREKSNRPAGWLDLSFDANTAVSYNMDMMASKLGFKNKLQVKVLTPVITSSVDGDVFFRAGSMNVEGDLSNPIGWNSDRTWRFNISSSDPELFMLREHAFLVQDLVEDFTTGPAAGFYTFVPFIYALGIDFKNLKIYLNANDLNIIDKPVDLSDNSFLVLQTDTLNANVEIPANQLDATKNSISFKGNLKDTLFKVNTPAWNTYSTFLDVPDLGIFPSITVDGSYTYFSTSSPALTDTLLMNVRGEQSRLYLYGFLIRLFMTFRENYFGEDTHFQTIEEYQARLQKPGRKHAGDNDHKPAKQSSDLDVILSVKTRHGCVLLPSRLYSASDCIKLDFEEGDADLRFTNYYMDLQTTVSPLSLSHAVAEGSRVATAANELGVQTFIDGLSVTGHRLFGLPPAEPTYVCNWDFDVGEVTGEASIEYLGALVSGVQTLVYSLDDHENALPMQDVTPLNDVTFLRASTKPIRLWLNVDQTAMLCNIDSARIEFNDWTRHRFSERLYVVVPRIILAAVDGQAASRRRAELNYSEKATTYGYLQTSLDIRMVSSKANFTANRRQQQEHIRLHDMRTNRTPWLLREGDSIDLSQYQPQLVKLQQPASSFPQMPAPLQLLHTENFEKPPPAQSDNSSRNQHRGPDSSWLSQQPVAFDDDLKSLLVVVPKELSKPERSSTSDPSQMRHHPTHQRDQHGKATVSSSYEQPYFPLLTLQADDVDVPELDFQTFDGFGYIDDVDIDEMPLEDDEMEHMTLMIAFKTGFKAVLMPPALSSLNNLLATFQSRKPDSLLDTLQMRSLESVYTKKQHHRIPKITQLRVQVPGLAIRFRHHTSTQLRPGDKQQTYDFAMGDLKAIARFGAERGESSDRTPSSMQISLAKVEMEARRSAYNGNDEARVLMKLSGLKAWLYEAEETVGELHFHALETASLNQKIENLAALVNSAATLANELGQEFSSTIASQSARMQFLMLHLTNIGKDVPDPGILSGASFISRRWEEVVRTSDSWKMIVRLRWILCSLDLQAATSLAEKLMDDRVELAADSLAQTLSRFKDWRHWDLDHPRASALIQAVYGNETPADRDTSRRRAKPIRFAFKSGTISLVIDPGKRSSKLALEGLGAAIQSELTVPSSEMQIKNSDYLLRKTTVEISCEGSLVEVKLELLDAFKDIFMHLRRLNVAQHSTEEAGEAIKSGPQLEQQYHMVLGMKQSHVRVRSRHLKAEIATEQLSTSITASTGAGQQTFATLLLSTRSIAAGMRASTRPLLNLVIKCPSIYGDLRSLKGDAEVSNNWKIGAQCQRIEIDILDSALGILGIADQVIAQEMVYLQGLAKQLQDTSSKPPTSIADSVTANDCVLVTLQLESYCITTVLFSSLRYRLEGKTTRSSLTPDSSDSRSHRLDFDTKDHAHSIFNLENGEAYEISRLALPPVNGRLDFKQGDRYEIKTELTISKIALDASAIHGLFTTLSRTELMSFRENVLRDFDIVKSNYDSTMANLGSSRSLANSRTAMSPKTNTRSEKPIVYSASVTLAGIAVLATSSNSLKTSAELTVDSGPIRFGIRNDNHKTGNILPFPELDLRLDGVNIILESLHNDQREPCGSLKLSISLAGTSELSDRSQVVRAYHASVTSLAVNIHTETASMIIDILGYLQQRFKHFNLTEEFHTFRARRHKRARSYVKGSDLPAVIEHSEEDDLPVALFDAIFAFQMHNLRIIWHVGENQLRSPMIEPENLVFSVHSVALDTKKGNTARLEIKDLQLQMAPSSEIQISRSKNSALLPEVVFRVAYMSRTKDRRLAVKASGKALDLRLTSQFMLPAVNIQKSIGVATQDLRKVLTDWNETLIQGDSQQKSVLGDKKLASLTIDADFAGAKVYMEGRDVTDPHRSFVGNRGVRNPREGRFGQFTQADSRSSTTLESPGLAFRVEYVDTESSERHLNGEVKVAASSNILRPMFVPLVLEILASVKDIVGNSGQSAAANNSSDALITDKAANSDPIADPARILGSCKLNLGVRICQQSFSLTCEPIARVTATARFQNIYITVSTVQPPNQERFFAVSSAITGLEVAVQHVYSRDPTGRFEVETIHMSLMNSRHLGSMTGISSILNVSPMQVFLNVKQLQDFLLFREIWYPVEIRPTPQTPTSRSPSPVRGGVQRFQQATASNAFSWNAAIHIAGLELSLDLGQAVGRLAFSVNRLWVTSKKDSEREQNLCLGFDSVGMESKGRMSGSVQLRNMRIRTNIVWPAAENPTHTPLVQASLGFDDLRAKASFDYQTFAVVDFQSLTFLLYNVTDPGRDRLVCMVNGDKIQAYITANAAAQSVAVYQAINRVIEEKQAAFQSSLKEMEKFQRTKAAAGLGLSSSQELSRSIIETPQIEMTPVSLQVNVVVSLNALRAGIYPRAFRDVQIFKIEALDALARFGVSVQEEHKVHTLLTVVLGQLRVALSTVDRTALRPKVLGENVSIEDVVKCSAGSRGGTILKVPRVVASMQTWQVHASKEVEYIFRSTFEGKVAVGWNYSRISFIRSMWDMHTKALVQRLGKLPQSAVQITSSPRPDADKENSADEAQEKITAVVNVPQSKYTYEAREPPIIQTPQLRDMGEATPPLEWIGLQRDKLPNLTHQVIIVPLLEFSKEVEDAYGKILGAS